MVHVHLPAYKNNNIIQYLLLCLLSLFSPVSFAQQSTIIVHAHKYIIGPLCFMWSFSIFNNQQTVFLIPFSFSIIHCAINVQIILVNILVYNSLSMLYVTFERPKLDEIFVSHYDEKIPLSVIKIRFLFLSCFLINLQFKGVFKKKKELHRRKKVYCNFFIAKLKSLLYNHHIVCFIFLMFPNSGN